MVRLHAKKLSDIKPYSRRLNAETLRVIPIWGVPNRGPRCEISEHPFDYFPEFGHISTCLRQSSPVQAAERVGGSTGRYSVGSAEVKVYSLSNCTESAESSARRFSVFVMGFGGSSAVPFAFQFSNLDSSPRSSRATTSGTQGPCWAQSLILHLL